MRLVEALGSLASDERLRARLAAGAKDTARAFDLAETVVRTERVLLNGSAA
jgi:hypothetical protein